MLLQNTSSQQKRETFLFLILLFIVLFMAAIKDWEYDEAWTYLGIQTSSAWDIITYSKFKIANNHLFNSLYFKLLQNLGVKVVFAYRLLSIVGFVLTYYATRSILKLLKVNSGYTILVLICPFFFHFSSGRGYSLAMAGFSMSLLCLLKYTQSPQIKFEYGIILWGGLSTLSIFSFLYGFLGIAILFLYFKRKQLFSIHTLFIGVIGVGLLLYVYRFGKTINTYDKSIIGSSSLIKNGTLASILSDFSYFNVLWNEGYYKYLRGLTLLSLLIPLFYIRKRSFNLSAPKTILISIFLIAVLIMEAAYYATGAKFPLSRAVYYLEYLLLLVLIISTVRISNSILARLPIGILFLISLWQTGSLCYDLHNPSLRETVVRTKDTPLYVFGYNPAIRLINHLYAGDRKNLVLSSNIPEQLQLIRSDSNTACYVLYPKIKEDSILLRLDKVYQSRGNMIFAKVRM